MARKQRSFLPMCLSSCRAIRTNRHRAKSRLGRAPGSDRSKSFHDGRLYFPRRANVEVTVWPGLDTAAEPQRNSRVLPFSSFFRGNGFTQAVFYRWPVLPQCFQQTFRVNRMHRKQVRFVERRQQRIFVDVQQVRIRSDQQGNLHE